MSGEPRPRNVALVTHAGFPDLAEDERPMIAALSQLGIRARPAVWTDPEVDWGGFDAAIVRSTWDYHLRRDEFLDWIDRNGEPRTAEEIRAWSESLLEDKAHLFNHLEMDDRALLTRRSSNSSQAPERGKSVR